MRKGSTGMESLSKRTERTKNTVRMQRTKNTVFKYGRNLDQPNDKAGEGGFDHKKGNVQNFE